MTAHAGATVQVPPPGVYRLDPEQSTVSYSGRHMFGLGTVHATFTLRSGDLRVADPPTDSTATVTLDPASFHSSIARRDKDVVGRSLLDVGTYPDITFVSDGVREDGGHWRMTGRVTAHGSTVPVELVVRDVHPEGAGIRLRAGVDRLDRHSFGITGSRGIVGRYFDLDVDVLAITS